MDMRNPALEKVSFLVGKWSIELSNTDFLPDPDAKSVMEVEYRWIEEGAAIAVQQGKRGIDPQTASWIIGREETSNEYTVLYNDSRGVSRIYFMSYQDNIWKMWRDDPKFMQRFEGKVSKDHATIQCYWENSVDGGKTWKHDFDMLFTKA